MKINRIVKLFKFIASTLIAYTFTLNICSAQIAPEDFRINITPKNPKNGETYLLFLDQYNIDISKADIAWVRNGNLVNKGFGLISQPFVMNESADEVDVFITMPNGVKYNKKIRMLPRSISLTYEGKDSFTPYWYEGKRFSTPGDKVRVYAFASISDGKNIIKNSDLYYQWEMNEEVVQGGGLGVNYIDIDIPESADTVNEVRVTVSPRLSSDSISESINVKSVSPQVLIMATDGLNTKFSRNLTGSIRTDRNIELNLTGIPLFYNIMDTLDYNWVINNKNNNTTSNIRVLKIPDSAGTASVKLKIDNNKKLLQYGSSELLINF